MMWYLLFLTMGVFLLGFGYHLGVQAERRYGSGAAIVQMYDEIAEHEYQKAQEAYQENELSGWLDNEIASMRLQNYKV